MIGEFCIVRTYSAGVHVGYVREITGTACMLTETFRVWRWTEGFTLHALATDGPKEGSRLSVTIPKILLTEAIEIIPCTEQARAAFLAFLRG